MITIVAVLLLIYLLAFALKKRQFNLSRLGQRWDSSAVELSPEQQALFYELESSSDHIFVTGKAGTGKSVLLRYFQDHTAKNMVCVAPTGVAAFNIGGQTIHSLFRIAPTVSGKTSDITLDHNTKLLLRRLDVVVIDEISMVRVDLMEAIDHKLKLAKKNQSPFGGVQIIMFGDLYQLPPVVDDASLGEYFLSKYGGPYFFNAPCWQSADMKIYELSAVYRQRDTAFKEILNSIREGHVSSSILKILNGRYVDQSPEQGVITLAASNATVSRINQQRLDALPGKPREYRAQMTGKIESSAFPTDLNLRLKVGAQVILLKNDPEKRWVNGSLCSVRSMDSQAINIDIGGKTYSVHQETWDKVRYSFDSQNAKVISQVVGTYTQFPVRLAWAITVHKSQGQTYERVAIDLGHGAFAPGQAYVALSRATSLEGLYIKTRLRKKDIFVDPTITAFMKNKSQLLAQKSFPSVPKTG